MAETRTAPGSIAQIFSALNIYSASFHGILHPTCLSFKSLAMFIFHVFVQPYSYFLKNRFVDVFSYLSHCCDKRPGQSNLRIYFCYRSRVANILIREGMAIGQAVALLCSHRNAKKDERYRIPAFSFLLSPELTWVLGCPQ